MKARVKWLEDMTFVGESGSGHAIVMDAAQEVGGHDLGVRPMEMLLLGLGGCTAIDVLHILRKARQSVEDCTVEISAERADTDPKVFERVQVHFVISGANLREEHVKRAISLSAEKYCSVSIMLGKTAEMSHTYELHEIRP
ncbi:MAG: OsmC family protein [Gammaproteobacteria bacterium]|nr:OsmC family protein [Gammaproteobacteria bacterium]